MIRANLGTTYLASILKQFEVNNIQIPHDCTSWDLLGSPLSFLQSNEHTSQPNMIPPELETIINEFLHPLCIRASEQNQCMTNHYQSTTEVSQFL
jgi:hypothetical protein